MKKNNHFLIFGIILLVAGFIILKINSSKIEFNLEKFASEKYIFVNDEKENSFSYLCIEKYDKEYRLSIKTRKYYLENDSMYKQDFGFSHPITESNKILTNDNIKIKATFSDNGFTFEGKEFYSEFNGFYKYVSNLNKGYELPKFEKTSVGGLYKPSGDKNGEFYIGDQQKDYNDINGIVRDNNSPKFYSFTGSEIDLNTNTIIDINNTYKFTFLNDKIIIQAYETSTNNEIEHILN